MIPSTVFVLLTLATGLQGLPQATQPTTPATTACATTSASAAASAYVDWKAGDYTIHESCNATEHAQLKRALGEMITLSTHAKTHMLRFGRASSIFQKYFGDAPSAEPIGWYERIIGANRSQMLFRCDDPDRNCATQDGWAGHWRGENATQETVICPLSYQTRRPLEAMCGFGYTVSGSPPITYFAADLLHRVMHVPTLSEETVDHYAEDYDGVVELAKTNSSLAVRNSDTLQYFALEVYSFDAVPGVGCV